MKRYSIILIAVFCLFNFLAACASPATPVPTPDANAPLTRLRIGVLADLPPYTSYDAAKQEVSGFDVDLLKTIAKKADVYLEFVTVTAGHNYLITQVAGCQLDGGISAIAIADGLTGQIGLSEPYFSTGQVIVVKKGNIKISGRETLSGMTVGTQANSLSAQELAKIPGVQPRLFESFHLAFQELISGNIDAVIADHPRAWNYVKVKPNNLKIVGDEFAPLSYSIAFCNNQTDLLTKVNAALSGMKKDGSLDKLIKEWQLTKFE